jgi:hypothetical protein
MSQTGSGPESSNREILDAKGNRDNPLNLGDIPFTLATGVRIPLETQAILNSYAHLGWLATSFWSQFDHIPREPPWDFFFLFCTMITVPP